MKTTLLLSRLTVILAVLLAALAPARAEDLESEKKDTAAAIEAFKKSDSTLAKYFSDAAGYALFPKVGKGGFIVGGAHGTGLVYEKGALIGEATLSQASIGAQIGGQSFSEVIFFETEDALKSFKNSEWAMSAQVGAVAASEGAAKNAKYQEGSRFSPWSAAGSWRRLRWAVRSSSSPR